jgi:uncharacterized protein YdaU (DUF1376 family)
MTHAPHTMQWHWGDYWRDTLHLTHIERSAYQFLLGYAWVHGGNIPDDDRQLMAICHLHHKQWKASRDKLRALFMPDASIPPMLSHKRIGKELANSLKYHERQSTAVKARYYRGSTKPLPTLLHTPDSQDVSSSKKEDTSLASSRAREEKFDQEESFQRFWQSYPEREGGNSEQAARESFGQAVEDGVDPQAIVDGAKGYAEAQARLGNVGTRYIASAARWLDDKRWTETQPSQPTMTLEEQDAFMAGKGYAWDGKQWRPTNGGKGA